MKEISNYEEFKKENLKNLEQKYEFFKTVKRIEKHYEIEGLHVHPITARLYHEATLSFVNGLFLASILAIGSAIDQLIRQFVDPKYKQREWIPKSNFNKAVEQGFITSEIKKEIDDFKYSIRDPVAHIKGPTLGVLGLPYNKEHKYWGGEDVEPIIPGPKPSAEKGIELFCRIVKYSYKTKKEK